MIELQLLNLLISEKSMMLLRRNGVTSEHFVTYTKEAEFIFAHYEKYQVVPDPETILDAFNEFDFFEVTESPDFLIERIKEQYLYNEMVPFVNTLNQMTAEDSEKAVQYATTEIERLTGMRHVATSGYDIIENAPERGKEYKTRLEAEGLIGITTGIKEFDDITHGWFPGEELVVILGRTNEGKTWVLLFFLVAAWKSGKTVLLYSGEMPKDIIGFRFDTLADHFSHGALTTGTPDLGNGKTPDDYYEHLENLSKDRDKPAFIVVTQKDFGGRKPTVSDISSLIDKVKPDIVGLDQLSLMEDERSDRGQQERIRFTHIAEDLYALSEKKGVPILTPSQANRSSAGKDDEETPELHEIAESDGIGQNATRVIGMKQFGTTLKLTVRKSRYSKKGSEILLLWDIDMGLIKPFMAVENSGGEYSSPQTKPTSNTLGGVDLF